MVRKKQPKEDWFLHERKHIHSCKKRKILSHSHLLKTELNRVKGVVILTYEKK